MDSLVLMTSSVESGAFKNIIINSEVGIETHQLEPSAFENVICEGEFGLKIGLNSTLKEKSFINITGSKQLTLKAEISGRIPSHFIINSEFNSLEIQDEIGEYLVDSLVNVKYRYLNFANHDLSIESGTFANNEVLEEANINALNIGDRIFEKCQNLRKVTLKIVSLGHEISDSKQPFDILIENKFKIQSDSFKGLNVTQCKYNSNEEFNTDFRTFDSEPKFVFMKDYPFKKFLGFDINLDPSTSSTHTTDPDQDRIELTAGLIAGGVILIAAICIVVVILLWKRRKVYYEGAERKLLGEVKV